MLGLRRATLTAFLGAAAILVAACGTSTNNPSSSGNATVPSDLSVTSFDASFSYMAKLKNSAQNRTIV